MEIILKQDVPKLGFTNEIVKVKDGYARNYLIPQGMAIVATPSNRKMQEEIQRQKSFKEEKIRKEAETLAKALDGITVKIGAKASESGKIYGSVNNIQIAEAIKEQFDYDVDRKKIELKGDAIKELGKYTAVVHLYRDVNAEVNFEVIGE